MTKPAPPDALSITALAKRLGVSKQAVHRRVSAMITAGQLETYPGPNRSVLISASAYDFAVSRNGDPAKEASAAMSRPAPASPQPAPESADESPGYRDAKARDAYYSAELKRLSLEREQKQLYPVEDVSIALQRIAERTREVARNIVAKADECAEAYEAGMPALRRFLSGLGDDICRTLASEYRILASEAEAQPSDEGEPEGQDEPP